MICAIMQPTMFPWLGYFDLIDQSDVFIFLNDVQFSKQSWQTRNRISTSNGIYLISKTTVKCSIDTQIRDVHLDKNKEWNKKLLKTLQLTYSKSQHFEEVFDWMTFFLEKDFERLEEFTISFIKEVSKKIGISKRFVISSELGLKKNNRVDKLIELNIKQNSSTYLSTVGSFDYLDVEDAQFFFHGNGIDIFFQNYIPQKYDTGKLPFEPYMSILDALFHCGFDYCLSIIKAGRQTSYTFDEYKKIKHG